MNVIINNFIINLRHVAYCDVGQPIVAKRTDGSTVTCTKVRVFDQRVVGVHRDVVVPSREVDVVHKKRAAVDVD